MGDTGQLGDLQVRLYRALLANPGKPVPDIASELESSVDDLAKPLAALVDFGLLRPSGDDVYLAVSPMLAEATVLGAEDLELALAERRWRHGATPSDRWFRTGTRPAPVRCTTRRSTSSRTSPRSPTS